ncbi:MAG: carbohydrate ABC transporter permease, partial [bacterium]
MTNRQIEKERSVKWQQAVLRSRRRRQWKLAALTIFLSVVSIPILLAYLWMVTIAFTAKTGGVETATLWIAAAILTPMLIIYAVIHNIEDLPNKRRWGWGLIGVGFAIGVVLLWDEFHLGNFR